MCRDLVVVMHECRFNSLPSGLTNFPMDQQGALKQSIDVLRCTAQEDHDVLIDAFDLAIIKAVISNASLSLELLATFVESQISALKEGENHPKISPNRGKSVPRNLN